MVLPAHPATEATRSTPRLSTPRATQGTVRKAAPRVASSDWVDSVRLCIRQRESHGNYRIVSRGTYKGMHAYGAYQFQDPTWHSVTGLPGHASDYPPAVQDAAFLKLFANGKGKSNWNYPPKQCW